MNPRGVEPNEIKCHARNTSQLNTINQEMKKIFAQGDIHDANRLYELAREKASLCQYDNLYKYASTTNTVQDIESIRATLGIKKLNFYMASYGTRLGLAYLVKYPNHVQRIILDGTITPSNQLASLNEPRAFGAVTTLREFFQNCANANSKCVLNSFVPNNKHKNLTGLIEKFNDLLIISDQSNGLPTGNKYASHRITSNMIKNILYTEMQPSNWKNLANALYEAEKTHHGDQLMKLYIANTQYNPSTNHYEIDNNDATRQSVICEDYTLPNFYHKTDWIKFVNNIYLKYSDVGVISTLWLIPMCIHWQVNSTPTLPSVLSFNKLRTPQVMIIGNMLDPMTPLKNAIAAKKYLQQFGIESHLIEWNGLSHTALITDSPLSTCVFNVVDKFLLDKKLSGIIKCNDWKNPFLT